MRTAIVMLVAVATSGCGLGLGTARVGSWSPREEVAYQACLVPGTATSPGPVSTASGAGPWPDRCAAKKVVTEEIPGRKFWGLVGHYPSLGYSSVSHAGESYGVLRFGASLEFLRGQGRWAWGVRGGIHGQGVTGTADPVTGEVDPEDAKNFFTTEVAVMGHYAPIERVSLYGGLGYMPYTSYIHEETSLGYRLFGGLQLPLGKAHGETPLVFLFEADRMTASFNDTYTSLGFSAMLGLFF